MENLRQHIADATDDTFKKELEASIASTDEAALFERIFGHPPQPSERGGQ
ncbi:hypothetical protein [Streptomyces sp. AK02-01A]|nr:hypothetical protein [Streptomyces sp. AK02-01A]MDX3853574.1 hypothetical protein [Streptomyces sp. AK02-01A]